ncbi:MAG: O-methyltransferase [Bacteroidota bacterium]
MDFIPKEIEEYALSHTDDEMLVLMELARETQAKVLQPRMLSGKLQGKLLMLISQMIQPKYILEIGTYTGYSAICLAQGLVHGGILHTIENNEELEDFARLYFKKANLEKKIVMHIGDALEVLPNINDPLDLVFIDADKANYVYYYKQVIDKVNPGGFILVDNVLWSGKVLEQPAKNDFDTLSLIQFNKLVQNDDSVENLMLPFRDGLSIIRKKNIKQ